MPRKGFRIGERVWLIREMLCGNGFRGKKHQKEKSDQKKHRQFFCFHRVYLPYSFAIVYEKTQTDIPGHMCIEEIQCE